MYVGQTVHGEEPNQRWRNGKGYESQQRFYNAIKKYGWDGFDHEVAASNLTKSEANNFERLLIKTLKTNSGKYGYNSTDGGGQLGRSEGYRLSEESKGVLREKLKKRYLENNLDTDGLKKPLCQPVYQFTTDGLFVGKYYSIKEAERKTGISDSTIHYCATGCGKHAGGYIFLFKENVDDINRRVIEYQKNESLKGEKIVQLSLDGKYINEWGSAFSAGKQLNINYKNINSVCRNKRNKAGGFKWMYLFDYNKLHTETSQLCHCGGTVVFIYKLYKNI